MNKQREALELAQKAIKAIELTDDFELTMKASRAIREALAEPEQKPVAYVDKNYGIMRINDGIDLPIGAKLYTAPPARKPLTDEQIKSMWGMYEYREYSVEFAREIELAHGIGD